MLKINTTGTINVHSTQVRRNTRNSELVKFWATNGIRRPTNPDPVPVQSDTYSHNKLFKDITSYLIFNILNIIRTLFSRKIIDP
jgi:hypothetical protein